MSDRADPVDKLKEELDHRRVDFLKTDLALCFSFADLAHTRLKMGNQESAEKAIAAAEKGYETLSRFLTEPRHVSHLTADQIKEFTAELKRLRERLDGLRSEH